MKQHYTRRQFLDQSTKVAAGVCFGAGALSSALHSEESLPRSKRPNVLMIAVDDLNNSIGCIGNWPRAITPNIDRLASRGTLFADAHCPAPICVPARTAVLSGISPSRSGCYVNTAVASDNAGGMDSAGLRESIPMSAWFAQHGYATRCCGKVAHGAWVSNDQGATPLWQETAGREWTEALFEDLEATPEGFGRLVDVHPSYPAAFKWAETPHGGPGVLGDEFTTAWSIERIRQHAPDSSRPFFLAAGFVRPHTPLFAPPEYFNLYDHESIVLPSRDSQAFDRLSEFAKAIELTSGGHGVAGGLAGKLRDQNKLRSVIHAYLACTSYVDACIGRLLSALDDSPHAENTLVALWSDHGWSLGQRHHVQKWALSRPSTHVPLILSGPGVKPGRCGTPVSTLDLYPTLAELCGLPRRPEWEGHSLVPLIGDPGAPWNHAAITTYGPGNHAVRSAAGTLVRYQDGSEEFYDPADVDEQNDRSGLAASRSAMDQLARFLPQAACMPFHWKEIDPRVRLRQLKAGDDVRLGSPLAGIAGKGIHIRTRARVDGSDALFVSYHGITAGFAFYVKDSRLCFGMRDVPSPLSPASFEPVLRIVRGPAVPDEGMVDYEARLSADGALQLIIAGKKVWEETLPGPLSHAPVAMVTTGFWKTFLQKDEAFLRPGDFPPLTAFPGTLEAVSVNWIEKA